MLILMALLWSVDGIGMENNLFLIFFQVVTALTLPAPLICVQCDEL